MTNRSVSSQKEAIRFYCGVSDFNWNRGKARPGRYVCVSPVNGRKIRRPTTVKLPPHCKVLQDSGAFTDTAVEDRLTPEQALERQEEHAIRNGYAAQICYRATYDKLIFKFWDDSPYWDDVEETVLAAAWLSLHRCGLPLVITAQGATPAQYMQCVKWLLPYLHDEDALGLGGWVAIGKTPSLIPIFRRTMQLVIPYAAARGVKRVHIWGVVMPRALAILLWEADKVGIAVSTDSSGPVRKVGMSDWGYGEWRDNTYKHPTDSRARYQDRVRHVKLTREWLANFRNTPNYPAMTKLPLFKEMT